VGGLRFDYDYDYELPVSVTQRQIAECLGMSTATVSLALQGHPRISETTRTRVAAKARELGYIADPSLSALAQRRWQDHGGLNGLVAMVFPDRRQHPRPDRCAESLRIEAEQRWLRFEPFFLEEIGSVDRLFQILRARGIEGLLLPPSLPAEFYRHDGLRDFALVLVHPDVSVPDLDQVRQNYDEAVRLVFRQIEARAFQRPAMAFVYERTLPDYGETALALFDRLRRHDPHPLPHWTGHLRESDSLGAWAREVKPDVVIGSTAHVYWQLDRAGISIPRDLRFVALQKPDQDPRVAGMRNNFDRQCVAALDWIELKLRRRKLGPSSLPQTLSIQPEWQAGESLPD